MKYAFIINPNSGFGKKSKPFIANIEKLMAERADISIHITEGIMDATIVASGLADIAENTKEDIRVFACGGDGTLNEVLNGLYGRTNVELGVIPIGSGNDFVRNYPSHDFLDIESQLNGIATTVDLLKLSYEDEGNKKIRYCINGINIGFDGNAAILHNHLKQKKLFRGSLSYFTAVFMNLAEMRGQNLKIIADDKVLHAGEILLATVSNGRFCGGGVESCPNALVDDGLAEILIINKVTRRTFLRLMPYYIKGKLLSEVEAGNIWKYFQSDKISIEPASELMQFVVDGEEVKSGKVIIEVIKKGIKLSLPALSN